MANISINLPRGSGAPLCFILGVILIIIGIVLLLGGGDVTMPLAMIGGGVVLSGLSLWLMIARSRRKRREREERQQ